MDEKEKELEFDLDDILREFGGETAPEEPQRETAEEDAQEPEEAVQEPADREPAAPAETPEPVTGDTIRLDDLANAVKEKDTGEDTRRFQPVSEEETADAAQAEDSEVQEPFSDGWEPQFEQPMGDYIPPQPIVFRPRSRLRELKRKLIAGPEKCYYALSEKGVGKLQAAIFLCLLVVLLSAAATLMYALGAVPESRMRLMAFVQFFAMLVSALLGSYQLMEGVADLFHKRFTLNTMLAVTFAACCADGIFGLMEQRISCCAAFSLEVLMSLWSAYHKRVTQIGQMDTLRKAVRLDGVGRMADYFEGSAGLLRGEGQVEDFMDHYDAPAKPEKTLGAYALIALGISAAAAVTATVLHGASLGVQVLAVSLLAAVPATAFITVSRPTAVLEKRLHRMGSVICGWDGVEGVSGRLVFPLEHEDLFPAGACKMNGVKFYGDRDPDEVVAYATALIDAEGGGLAPLFTRLLDSRNGRHYDVENLNAYGSGGIGGEVNGEPVVAGNLAFMKEMGVEVPAGTRVDQAVYVAIDGELSGLFAITYSRARSSAVGLSALCGSRKLGTVLKTNDFMLTESFIRNKFGVSTRRMAFPEPAVRAELAAKERDEDTRMYVLTTQTGLAPIACAVTGARSLRTAAKLGVIIHLIGGIVGLAMMAVLAVLGAGHLLTPVNMLLYELVWMVPGMLITEWTRSA